MTTHQPPTTDTRPNRLSNALLVCIVLAVGTMAGAASFRHVHDWTMHNSPAHTPNWFGWANAVITELIPTAALIIIAQRRRTGGHIAYPMFLLIAAVSLSLTAQLAVALPTVFGWMVSALPSLAFFALSKLVFTQTHTAADTTPPVLPVPADTSVWDALAVRLADLESRPTPPAPTPAPPAPATAPSPDTATGASRNSVTPEPPARIAFQPRTADTDTAPRTERVPAADVAAQAPTVPTTPVSLTGDAPLPTALIAGARLIAESHQNVHGQPITAGQLAVRLRIDTRTADKVLATLTGTDPHHQPVTAGINGYHHSSMDVPA